MGKQTGALSTIRMRQSAAPCTFLPLLLVFLFGCRTSGTSTPRYTVTATPVDVVSGGFGLCIAVDPADTQGVWWWQPGPSGCASRITGPTVFAGDRASVRASRNSGSIEVNFSYNSCRGLGMSRSCCRTQRCASRHRACGSQLSAELLSRFRRRTAARPGFDKAHAFA